MKLDWRCRAARCVARRIGALMALENAGLEPAFIAGTSIGALVGALYAAGNSAGELAEIFADIGWSSLLGPSLPRRLSLFDVKPMERLLGERLKLTTFEALEIPFAAVACDITAGEEVVLRTGDLTSAVLASCALPGVFPPIERDDRLLVDGGVINNLPVDVVRAMGAETVIAIDLLPPWHALGAPESLFEVWERSITLLIQGNQRAQAPAEITVQPALAAFSFTNLTRSRK